MHPLVADVYRLRVESDAPLRWADAHYTVLQRDEGGLAANHTALQRRQINFMMQSETNTSFVLNYIYFSPSAGETLAAQLTLQPMSGDVVDTEWHRYATDVADASTLSFSNAPAIAAAAAAAAAEAEAAKAASQSSSESASGGTSAMGEPVPIKLPSAPLAAAATTFPVASVGGKWSYVAAVLPAAMIGLATGSSAPSASAAATAAASAGPGATAYALLFQTSLPQVAGGVRSAFMIDSSSEVQVAALQAISSTVWQQSPLWLSPNQTLAFQMQFRDLSAGGSGVANSTSWYNYRAPLLALQESPTTTGAASGMAASLLPELSAQSAQSAQSNLAAFLSQSESSGVCQLVCPTGRRCLGGRCVDMDARRCAPSCSSLEPDGPAAVMPPICVDGECRVVDRKCVVRCTDGATCIYGFCLQPDFSARLGGVQPADFGVNSAGATPAPNPLGAAFSIVNAFVPISSSSTVATQPSQAAAAAATSSALTHPASWSSLDYSAHVLPSTATSSAPATSATGGGGGEVGNYSIFFRGSPAALGPQGGLAYVDVRCRVNGGAQRDYAMQALRASGGSSSGGDGASAMPIPLSFAPSLPGSALPAVSQTPLPGSAVGAASASASTPSATRPILLDFVLERVSLRFGDTLAYSFSYATAAGQTQRQQQGDAASATITTPWHTFSPREAQAAEAAMAAAAAASAQPVAAASLPSTVAATNILPSGIGAQADVFSQFQLPSAMQLPNAAAGAPAVSLPSVGAATSMPALQSLPALSAAPESLLSSAFPFTAAAAPMPLSSGLPFLMQSTPMLLPSLPPAAVAAAGNAPLGVGSTTSGPVQVTSVGGASSSAPAAAPSSSDSSLCFLPCLAAGGGGAMGSCLSSCTAPVLPAAGINVTSISNLFSTMAAVGPPPPPPGMMVGGSAAGSVAVASLGTSKAQGRSVAPKRSGSSARSSAPFAPPAPPSPSSSPSVGINSFPSFACVQCFERCALESTSNLLSCSSRCEKDCDNGLRAERVLAAQVQAEQGGAGAIVAEQNEEDAAPPEPEQQQETPVAAESVLDPAWPLPAEAATDPAADPAVAVPAVVAESSSSDSSPTSALEPEPVAQASSDDAPESAPTAPIDADAPATDSAADQPPDTPEDIFAAPDLSFLSSTTAAAAPSEPQEPELDARGDIGATIDSLVSPVTDPIMDAAAAANSDVPTALPSWVPVSVPSWVPVAAPSTADPSASADTEVADAPAVTADPAASSPADRPTSPVAALPSWVPVSAGSGATGAVAPPTAAPVAIAPDVDPEPATGAAPEPTPASSPIDSPSASATLPSSEEIRAVASSTAAAEPAPVVTAPIDSSPAAAEPLPAFSVPDSTAPAVGSSTAAAAPEPAQTVDAAPDVPASSSTGVAVAPAPASPESLGICNMACPLSTQQCLYGQCVDVSTPCRMQCDASQLCVNQRCRARNYGCDVDCASTTNCVFGFCIPTTGFPGQVMDPGSSSPSSGASGNSAASSTGPAVDDFVLVDPVSPPPSSTGTKSIWDEEPPPPGTPPPAPGSAEAPSMQELTGFMTQGMNMFQLFGQMIPGLSATPVGGIMNGLGTAAQMFTGALGMFGVGAADTRSSGRAAAVRTQSMPRKAAAATTTAAHPSFSTSAASDDDASTSSPDPTDPPCDFHSLSSCLNSCVAPSGSVDSPCVTACWDYPCAVAAAPGAAPTDPKALVRGLKLFSIFQQLAARTPIVDADAMGRVPQAVSAQQQRQQQQRSNSGARRLLQFPGLPPLGGGAPAAALPAAAPSGFGMSTATSVAQGLQSFLTGLTGGSTTTAIPSASTTAPAASNSFNTAAAAGGAVGGLPTGLPANPFGASTVNPFVTAPAASVSNPFATAPAASVANPFATAPAAAASTDVWGSLGSTIASTFFPSASSPFPSSSVPNPFVAQPAGSGSGGGGVSAASLLISSAGMPPAEAANAVGVLDVLSQASTVFASTYANDLAAIASVSTLPLAEEAAASGQVRAMAAASSSSGSTGAAPIRAPVLYDDLPDAAEARTAAPAPGPGNAPPPPDDSDFVPLACKGSALVNDGTQCAWTCASVFSSLSLVSAANCLSSCVNNPCIKQNLAQLQSTQMQRVLEANAKKNMPQIEPGAAAPGPAGMGGPVPAPGGDAPAASPAPAPAGSGSPTPPGPLIGSASSGGVVPADFAPFESFPLAFPPGGGGGVRPSSVSAASLLPSSSSSSSFYFPSSACVRCTSDCQSQSWLPLRECISRSEKCRQAGCLLPVGAD